MIPAALAPEPRATVLPPEAALCAHCQSRPLAYPGALYCGAGCAARAEAHEPRDTDVDGALPAEMAVITGTETTRPDVRADRAEAERDALLAAVEEARGCLESGAEAPQMRPCNHRGACGCPGLEDL